MVTAEEFEQVLQGIKELERLRKRWRELKERSLLGTSGISCGQAKGGHSDRVFDRIAALDELEREVKAREWQLIDRIYHPFYGYCWEDERPNAPRVWDILVSRCKGESWNAIGRTQGVQGSYCKRLVQQYRKRL